MSPEVAHAISVELNFTLKPNWSVIQTAQRFEVTPAAVDWQSPGFSRLLRQEVWRVAQFISYSHFVSIESDGSDGYFLASRMDTGDGFEVHFLSK